jgi:DNA-binding PadR family transcriptional regulator
MPPEFWLMGSAQPLLGPGEVRLAILSLLTDGPRHGYELMKMLAQRSGGIYRASAGTIYPTLQQLEDEGLIAAEAQEGKRVFRITEEGRRELRLEDDVVERIWRRAKMWNEWRGAFDPEVQEIVRPAERVMKAAFSAMSGGSASNADKVREILERALRELEGLRGKE